MALRYNLVLYYLWIAPHIFLAVVSVLMVVKRLHRHFPVFFTYTLYETAVFIILFLHRNTLIAPVDQVFYRYFFILTLGGSTALRFGIIQEIFNNVFRDYQYLTSVAARVMRWITGALVVAAIATAVCSSGTISDNLMAGVALLDRSVAIIQAGLLLFLFLFSRVFGLSWRNFTFGVGLGFGIFASMDLAVWALRLTSSRVSFLKELNLALTGSYHISALVWLGYLLAAERYVSISASPVTELKQWSQELERSL